MDLWAQFLNNKGRRIHKWTHYFPIYERHFASFVNKSTTFIEIGVSTGGSLQLWKSFLGPLAQIVGIDTRPECKQVEEHQIAVRIGNQADHAFLQEILDEFGPPDVVLDDGSHVQSDMVASFNYLYRWMSKNGVYMVEDAHTSYWPDFGGGIRKQGTFIELAKTLIDTLNADLSAGSVQSSEFTETTTSIHFYNSVVVFERGRHPKRMSLMVGQEAPTAQSG
jgi:hypothetical protein